MDNTEFNSLRPGDMIKHKHTEHGLFKITETHSELITVGATERVISTHKVVFIPTAISADIKLAQSPEQWEKF